MCGIVGYTGSRRAGPILLDGLRVLEYRGYDSAGMYVAGTGVYKSVGPVSELAKRIPKGISGTAGIGHTRWATHGPPTIENAHPHSDQHRHIWLAHNGIIENYAELRGNLESDGHRFLSQTDSEVLAHLIGAAYDTSHNLREALIDSLAHVRGTYGLVVMAVDDPETILAARQGSPIVLGIKEGEYFIGSDATPMVRHTQNLLFLKEGEYVVVSPKGYDLFSFEHEPKDREPEHVTMSFDAAEKGGHAHFMLKEIMEVPKVLEDSARGRINKKEGTAKLGGLEDHARFFRNLEHLTIVGCGSAYYAGLVGKLLLEDCANLPVSVELGSEYRHRAHPQANTRALLAVSQSGETADTLACIREAQRVGMKTIGIVNAVGSSIARETDMGVYNHAGPELGVASTKAFVSQLEVFALLALYLGRLRGLSSTKGHELACAIEMLPEKIATILKGKDKIRVLAENYLGYDDFLYIGRGYNFGTAYEGALKLKEVSYVHAEGYGAGEMKHGPLAMIDDMFPTVAVMPSGPSYEKMRSNVEEIRARGGPILALATEGNDSIKDIVDDVLYIPDIIEPLSPILATVPLQLFAYHSGVLRGFNVDRPRNLAKSVTVE